MKKIILLFGLVAIIGNVYAQAQVPENLSDEAKIFGLSKVWKEADKNFVFFDQVPALDWDKTYQEFIPKVLETKSTYDYYKTLQEFCALLNDGHTKVVVPWQLREVKEIVPPITTELINNKVIITALLNDTLKNQGLKKGMEIIEINGINIHEYALTRVKPYVSYSTEQDMNVQVYDYHLLKGPIDEKVVLKTTTGKVYAISRKLTNSKAYTPAYEYRKLNEDTGYLKLNRFWGENLNAKFDSIFRNIQTMPKLIIDVSENTGGNNEHSNYILSHFVNKPFETSRWKTLMYMPAYASWGFSTQWQDNEGEIVKPKEESKRYNNPIVVLISEKTYSAGEDFVSAFLNTERGVVIGRPTAGSTGNPIGFSLPGKGGVQICSKRDYLSNGKEFVGYGIAPEIEVKKVIDHNHLINKGLEILKKEN